MQTKKVLFVLTSANKAANGKITGQWMEEFAAPYYLLSDNGVDITIASPKGGAITVDPLSLQPQFMAPSVERILEDKAALNRLETTLKLEDMNEADYDAIYYPGGHGPMWDLPQNQKSISLLEAFYRSGKPTALVCHAPAALENAKDVNGAPLVKGKQVSAFTNSEEIAGNTTDMVPYMLEDMLIEKGADFVKGPDWLPFSVQDGNLISGQNPASAEFVGRKVLAALGIEVAAHQEV